MRMKTLIAATAATAVIAGAGTVQAEELKLKAGFFIGAKKSLFRQAFDKFADELNAQCKGQVQITQVVSREAVPSRQIPNALKRGVIGIAGAPPSYFSGLVPGAAGFTAPRVDAATQRKNGAYKLIDDALGKRANAHLIAQYGFGVRFHIFTSKPVKSLADFKGMKLRTSNTYKAFFAALGAQPISMSRREIFTAMERGVVGGFANLNSEVKALGLGEVVKYRIDPSFYDTIVWIAINKGVWDKMTAAQKS
ncbi:MAG: TRAP transporter substrate-binding protein DctP [Bauldia litoralis]